ncbi:Tetratricopeptide repeat protein 39C [Oopsacas minuta]|uniref:Tetratricopeptide repeat protein 39C n=1 Tax=Oopsacas minuta TaxID=111878 RepID=A0AAV7K611_9METZ|nr:Tetratricopeptide repeat protein 39C [Oopsacas minuta]
MADEKGVSSDSVNHSGSLECTETTKLSEAGQSPMSYEEEESYARDGMITFLTDPDVAMEHFREGMRRGASPLIHYGYSFVMFVRSMLSFNETQQDEAYRVLEAAATHCHQYRKGIPKGSGRRIYYKVMQSDCELFQAFLHFTKETMTGYIKGGLGIRKAWKSYSKTYKKCEKLFTSPPPINPPFTDTEDDIAEDSEPIKSLLSEDSDPCSPTGLVDLELTPSDENRIRRAVYAGYGTFHLMLSLIPQKFLKLANLLGFQGDRRFALECLHYGLTGVDMREPIAAINLLWFQTLLVPYISMSQSPEDSNQLEESKSVLSHLTAVSPNSPLAKYFSGRIALLSRDVDTAMQEYQLCRDGSFFPREMLQITCQEKAYIAMARNDYELALKEIGTILETGTKFQSTYMYLLGLLTGYLSDAREALKLFENGAKQGTRRQHPIEKFSMRRCSYYTKQGVTYVGMHAALLEQLYISNAYLFCTPVTLAINLENAQSCVASATDPLARCLGLLTQGSVLKHMGCPNEAEESFNAILSSGVKALKNEKHILVCANIELSVLARIHRKDANLSIGYLHTARDKFSDYDYDGRLQLIINRELTLAKKFRRQSKV